MSEANAYTESYEPQQLTNQELEAAVQIAFILGRFSAESSGIFTAQIATAEQQLDEARANDDLVLEQQMIHELSRLRLLQLETQEVYNRSHNGVQND